MKKNIPTAITLVAALVLSQCRLAVEKSDVNFSSDAGFRCGIYHRVLFDKVNEEVYPDLGMVLANEKLLKLNDSQKESLLVQARNCSDLCGIKKEAIRLKEEALRDRIKSNAIRGNLSLVAGELREIETLKKKWLHEHRGRYRKGLQLLDPAQTVTWLQIEQMNRSFPDE